MELKVRVMRKGGEGVLGTLTGLVAATMKGVVEVMREVAAATGLTSCAHSIPPSGDLDGGHLRPSMNVEGPGLD